LLNLSGKGYIYDFPTDFNVFDVWKSYRLCLKNKYNHPARAIHNITSRITTSQVELGITASKNNVGVKLGVNDGVSVGDGEGVRVWLGN
jgi:hypothetical protein